jgi:hypothetical protein
VLVRSTRGWPARRPGRAQHRSSQCWCSSPSLAAGLPGPDDVQPAQVAVRDVLRGLEPGGSVWLHEPRSTSPSASAMASSGVRDAASCWRPAGLPCVGSHAASGALHPAARHTSGCSCARKSHVLRYQNRYGRRVADHTSAPEAFRDHSRYAYDPRTHMERRTSTPEPHPPVSGFPCPVCASTRVRLATVAQFFFYLRCDDCTHVWSHPERRQMMDRRRLQQNLLDSRAS